MIGVPPVTVPIQFPGPAAAPGAGYAAVRHRLEGLARLIGPAREIVYVDHAVYGNVGDLLISAATEAFLEDHGHRIIRRYSRENHNLLLSRRLPAGALIVFQGGGNFGDLFPGFQQMRQAVLEAHPQQEAILLPQTVYYRDKATLIETARAYRRFPRLTLCARDETSRAVLEAHFSNPIACFPDLAHHLQGRIPPRPPVMGATLLFLRQDQAAYRAPGAEALPDLPAAQFMDWGSHLSPREKRMIRFASRLHGREAGWFETGLPYRLWAPMRARILARAHARFQDSERVVTNRLHGLIFAMLANRPVQIVETGYGKLSAYHESWLHDVPGITIGATTAHKEAIGSLAEKERSIA